MKCIYASDPHTQIFYEFSIIRETETEYVVRDYSVPWDNEYYVDKQTLKFTSEKPEYSFVVNVDRFFASLEKSEVERKMDEWQMEVLERNLKRVEKELLDIERKLAEYIRLEYDVSSIDISSFDISDCLVIVQNSVAHSAVVSSLITTDKEVFTPRVTCKELDIYDLELHKDSYSLFVIEEVWDSDGIEEMRYDLYVSHEAYIARQDKNRYEALLSTKEKLIRSRAEYNSRLNKIKEML